MPVRKIPKNWLHVTGGFASRKNGRMVGFESLLEKEFMILLEFDDTVERFEEQPVSIPVPGRKRKAPSYVPDVLAHYKPRVPGGKSRKPVLYEVKHTTDLEKNKLKYRPKFAAARQFAKDQGWEFRIITEKEIRTPYLANLKFLREYRNIEPERDTIRQVIQALVDCGGSAEYDALLDKLAPTDAERLSIIPVIWHLVAARQIKADLKSPISGQMRLSLPKGTAL